MDLNTPLRLSHLNGSMSRKEYLKKWRENNPEKVKLKFVRFKEKNPHKVMFMSARSRALKKNLEFSITADDIIIPEVCPILGTKFEVKTPYAASLDRIDATKGYTKDNIWVISQRANQMKSDASPEELRRFAQWVENTL